MVIIYTQCHVRLKLRCIYHNLQAEFFMTRQIHRVVTMGHAEEPYWIQKYRVWACSHGKRRNTAGRQFTFLFLTGLLESL